MTMTPRIRKLALTAHVTSSVGWLGAVVAFLALAVAGLSGRDAEAGRPAYIAMGLITWWVIVPASLVSLVSGLVQGLGTSWGLVRHYWVAAKLGVTVLSTLLLLLHTRPIGYMAAVAAGESVAGADLHHVRVRLVADAGAALLALLLTTTLSVFKPRGLTPYGRRMRHSRGAEAPPEARP